MTEFERAKASHEEKMQKGYKQSKTADEMFEELGFIKKLCYGGFRLINNENIEKRKVFHFDFMPDNKLYITGEINNKELKALVKMSEELGWLDE